LFFERRAIMFAPTLHVGRGTALVLREPLIQVGGIVENASAEFDVRRRRRAPDTLCNARLVQRALAEADIGRGLRR